MHCLQCDLLLPVGVQKCPLCGTFRHDDGTSEIPLVVELEDAAEHEYLSTIDGDDLVEAEELLAAAEQAYLAAGEPMPPPESSVRAMSAVDALVSSADVLPLPGPQARPSPLGPLLGSVPIADPPKAQQRPLNPDDFEKAAPIAHAVLDDFDDAASTHKAPIPGHPDIRTVHREESADRSQQPVEPVPISARFLIELTPPRRPARDEPLLNDDTLRISTGDAAPMMPGRINVSRARADAASTGVMVTGAVPVATPAPTPKVPTSDAPVPISARFLVEVDGRAPGAAAAQPPPLPAEPAAATVRSRPIAIPPPLPVEPAATFAQSRPIAIPPPLPVEPAATFAQSRPIAQSRPSPRRCRSNRPPPSRSRDRSPRRHHRRAPPRSLFRRLPPLAERSFHRLR